MNTNIIRGAEISRPTPQALRSSVLDHANVVTKQDFGLRNDEGLWPSYNLVDTGNLVDICPNPADVKVFDFAGWVPGFTFALQAGVQCNSVGLDVADQRRELERVVRANEGRDIERALRSIRFAEPDSDSDWMWAAPVDVTPGSGANLVTALALLEGYAAATYAGVPTLHLPRAAASLLGDRIVWEGAKAFTRNGSKVAMGGGYDDALPTGEWDLFATGEVYVEQSAEILFQSYVVPGDGNGVGSDETGIAPNTSLAIAERLYRVGVDGFTAQITATVWP